MTKNEMALRLLIENLSGLVVLVGFVALEAGITQQWSWALAAIVGGTILIAVGAFPYVRRALRSTRESPRTR